VTIQMVRVQEKGRVTIPLEIRQKLNLKKGDMVTFVETADGVMIIPVEIVTSQTLTQIGQGLKQRGVELSELMDRGRELREGLIKDEYYLPDRPES
jgi:AbrB family looped-hinge helix DNA binding protein